MNRRSFFIGLCSLSSLQAQAASNLVVDSARPYVYIKFDHAGFQKRQSTPADSNARRIWLRLVNNCRLPIRVMGFDPGTGDAGIGLSYSVVPESGITETGSALEAPKGAPRHAGTRINVAAAHDVLFSIPASHVAPEWHIEIEFEFDLPDPKHGFHPVAKAAFAWHDIPERQRGLK